MSGSGLLAMAMAYSVRIYECVCICVCEKIAGNEVSKPEAMCTNGGGNSFTDEAVLACTIAAGGLSAVLRSVMCSRCTSMSSGSTVIGA